MALATQPHRGSCRPLFRRRGGWKPCLLRTSAKGSNATAETWERLEEMRQSKEPLECDVVKRNEGGVIVRVMEQRGFVPNSHLVNEERESEGTLEAVVMQSGRDARGLILSERGAKLARLADRFQRGKEAQCEVRRVMDFGAFLELIDDGGERTGIVGLVRKKEISWSWVQARFFSFVVPALEIGVTDERYDGSAGCGGVLGGGATS